MLPRVGDGIRGDIDARRGSRPLRQLRGSITGAASDIENASVGGQPGGECIAGDVLRPEIVVDFAGDHSFAREFAHRDGTPGAGILTFTSTRHGKWNWP